MAIRVFSAIIHRDGDWYVADCPETGTVSQGHSIEQALANLKQATELYLEETAPPSVSNPILTTFSVETSHA